MAKEITNNQVVEVLRKEIRGVRNELKGDIGNFRGEVKSDIGSLRGELKAEIQSTKKELIEKIEEDTEFLARVTNSNFSQLNKKVDAEVERKDDQDLKITEVKARVAVLEKQVL